MTGTEPAAASVAFSDGPGAGAPSYGPSSGAQASRTLLATALVGAALALGAAASAVGLLIATAVVQALLVVTWALAAGPPLAAALSLTPSTATVPGVETLIAAGRWASAMPGRIGTVIIGAGASAGADVAVSVRPHDALAPVLAVLGLALPAMFVHQLSRGVVRVRVVESLSGIAVVVVCVVALSALMQLRHESDGARMTVAAVLVAAVAVTVGHLVDLIWSRPRFDPAVPRGLGAVAVAIVAGAGVGVLVLRPLTQYGTGIAALLCALVAAVAVLVSVCATMIGHGIDAGASDPRAGRILRPIALAIMALSLVAPVSYLLLLVR